MTDRDSSWWIHPEDDEHDMRRLLEVVGASDWAVFANAQQDPDAPPPVALALARSSDGRVICKGLIVGLNEGYPIGNGRHGVSMEVTSRALRAIPIPELIGKAVHTSPRRHEASARTAVSRASDLVATRRAPGPKGHPDEHFRMVADFYTRALEEHPDAPVVWLTNQLHANRSTVTRWVQRARDKGYLGEAMPGRAGSRTRSTDEET